MAAGPSTQIAWHEFIVTHQATVTLHISTEDSGQFALGALWVCLSRLGCVTHNVDHPAGLLALSSCGMCLFNNLPCQAKERQG